MGYAIMRINKIKTKHELDSIYNHNYRIFDVANADPERTHLNREIKGLNGLSYQQAVDEELIRMKINGYSGKAVRKDAVLGLEVMLTFSSEDKDKIPLESWIEKNLHWLDKNFNPKGHQIVMIDKEETEHLVRSDNVKSVMVHLDETVPHIHAFIIPLDEKGTLNAKSYTSGRNKLQHLQSDYAREMAEFGLRRGTKGQKASHKDVAKYYVMLNEAVSDELPKIREGEAVQEYRERANEEFQREKVHHRDDVLKSVNEVKEARSELLKERMDRYLEEDKLGKQIFSLARELGVSQLDEHTVRTIRGDLKKIRDLEKALENYPERDETEKIRKGIQTLIEWQQRQDWKKKIR